MRRRRLPACRCGLACTRARLPTCPPLRPPADYLGPTFLLLSAGLMLAVNITLVALLRFQCRGGRPNAPVGNGQARLQAAAALRAFECPCTAHNPLPWKCKLALPARPPTHPHLQWWRDPHVLLASPIRLITFLFAFVFSSTVFFAWQVRMHAGSSPACAALPTQLVCSVPCRAVPRPAVLAGRRPRLRSALATAPASRPRLYNHTHARSLAPTPASSARRTPGGSGPCPGGSASSLPASRWRGPAASPCPRTLSPRTPTAGGPRQAATLATKAAPRSTAPAHTPTEGAAATASWRRSSSPPGRTPATAAAAQREAASAPWRRTFEQRLPSCRRGWRSWRARSLSWPRRCEATPPHACLAHSSICPLFYLLPSYCTPSCQSATYLCSIIS